MRAIEAAAIALVYAVAVGMLASTAARQAVAVHHVGVERAVAYALLKCQNLTCFNHTVRQVAGAELHTGGAPAALKPRTFVSYGAVIYTPAITLAQPPPTAPTPWWDTAWRYARRVTVTNTAPGTTWWNTAMLYRLPVTLTSSNALSDQQVLITINTQSLIAAGKMRGDCGDIRVIDSDDRTELPYWVEPGTCNTQATRLWARIPSVPAGSKTIYIYYGNPSATSQSDASRVFARVIPNLQALFRLDEGSGTTTRSDPGSPSTYTGTLVNGPTWNRVGYGWSLWFDGLDDYVEFGNILNFAGKSLTISAWIYVEQLPPSGYTYPFIARRQPSGSYNADYLVEVTSSGAICFTYAKAGTYNWYGACTPGGLVAANRWHHVVATFDSSTTRVTIYVDGVQRASSVTGQQLTSNSGAVLRFGHTWYTGNNKWYKGVLDEVAFLDRALSPAEAADLYSYYAYTTANYKGYLLLGKPPAGLSISLGSEQLQPSPALDVTGYPVPVTIDTQSLIAAGKMRADCGDIRVIDSDNKTLLSYFVEPGTCNTQATRIWVRVPSIPANSTVHLYMYYGNPSATSLSDPSVLLVYEDFSKPPSGSLAGSATYDSANRRVQLTPATTNQLGYLYYTTVPRSPQGFYARFYLWVGGGTGGEAVWLGAYDTSYTGTREDVVNGGYHFTFDEYQDRVAFTKSTVDNGAPIAMARQADIDNSAWRLAEVYFWYDGAKACARILLDGATKVYACDPQPQQNVRSGTGQLVIGGRTGSATNYHRVGTVLLIAKYYPTVSAAVGSEAQRPLTPPEQGVPQLPPIVVAPSITGVRVHASP